MYTDTMVSTQPYTGVTGIVLARAGCEFGYPESTIKYMSAKYPHKQWDWRTYDIPRHDTDLVAEIVISPKRFYGVTEDNNSGVIFDHELFVKYIPVDIIESRAYRIDRHICGEEYIVIDMAKFQLYINNKIIESNIKNKLEKIKYANTMIMSRNNIQSICRAVDAL